MRHHGVDPTHVIRFVMTIKVARILDLTKPHLAAKYAYLGGPVSSATQAIGEAALRDGYKVIRYYSERVTGKINNAIMDDYNEVLNVQIVTQVRR